MGKFSFTEEKIWDIIEGLIDDNVKTYIESYKDNQEYHLEILDIIDSIEYMAMEIEKDMRDSL